MSQQYPVRTRTSSATRNGRSGGSSFWHETDRQPVARMQLFAIQCYVRPGRCWRAAGDPDSEMDE
eukprot:scaffold357025_cov32-Prasinocladus_malaysianus.AAC.1